MFAKLVFLFNFDRRRRRATLESPETQQPLQTLYKPEARNDKTRPILTREFVSGVRSNRYPVPKEFDILADADARHHAFSMTSDFSRQFSSSKKGIMNR
jgi:hypothetical protein